MAETSPNGYYLTGPDNRARQSPGQEYYELSSLLKEATRLIECTDLRGASETLKEATARADLVGRGEPLDPGTQ